MESKHKGLLYISIALVAAATITIITKMAILHGGDPTKILLLRFIIVVLFLIGYMRIKHISWRTSRKNFYGLIGLGFAYVNVSLLFFLSMKYISPSLGSLILYTYPMLVSILSAIILKEQFTLAKMTALLFSLSGCLLVIGTDLTAVDYRGVLLAFLTAVFFSIYIVGNKKILNSVEPIVSLAYMAAFSVVFFALKSIWDGTLSFQYSTVDVISALLLAIIPTLIGIIALFKALEILGASKSAIISSFEPVVTLLLAYVLIGDRITLVQLAGGAFILTSVFIVQRGEVSEAEIVVGQAE